MSVRLQATVNPADIRTASAYATTGGFAFGSLTDCLSAAEAFDRLLMSEAAAAATEAAKAFVSRENAVELVAFAYGRAGREGLLEWGVQKILKGGFLVRCFQRCGMSAAPSLS